MCETPEIKFSCILRKSSILLLFCFEPAQPATWKFPLLRNVNNKGLSYLEIQISVVLSIKHS